jgi:hypothetical protein
MSMMRDADNSDIDSGTRCGNQQVSSATTDFENRTTGCASRFDKEIDILPCLIGHDAVIAVIKVGDNTTLVVGHHGLTEPKLPA